MHKTKSTSTYMTARADPIAIVIDKMVPASMFAFTLPPEISSGCK